MRKSTSSDVAVGTSKFRKWILCIVGVLPLLCLSRSVAEGAGCKDTLSVRLGHTTETQADEEKSSAKAREFIWRHWTEKRCGKLLVRALSKEGVESTSHEKIQLLVGRAPVFIASISRSDGSTSSFHAYSVERVIPEVPYFAETARVVPTNKVIPPSQYRLRFRDKGGKLITDF